MSSESVILELLSAGEQKVYEFLKRHKRLKMSMEDIGKAIGEETGEKVSEATVHRAVRKLYKEGIIGIIASKEKADPNEIIYYGIPDAEQEVNHIIDMVNMLNQHTSRFQQILAKKEQEVERLRLELEAAKARESMSATEPWIQSFVQSMQEMVKGEFEHVQNLAIESAHKLEDGRIAVILRVNSEQSMM
ncbi:hypothetical protein [Alicyclobacillus shizuokensis]|uniref:hypothetical protein n=1 Tax=Alicyclobacillus shizuokensis TaxID=392014 RepID=UPI0008361FBF|nr:hypothetical protein [Alicyclobacillus shizuokensis]